MALLVAFGFAHARRTSPETEMLRPKPQPVPAS
jgi:hypothetical protein